MQALRSALLGASALTLSMIILAGCGAGSSPNFTSGSGLTPLASTAPTVVSVGEQANGDAPNRIQDVQFNEAMNSTTINNQTFMVKDGGGRAVPGVVTYNPQFQVASFRPTPALKTNTSYTLTVATGVASDEGVHLAQNYTSSFVTRSTVDSSPLYVASVMPQPNATCVSPNANITITFSEGVDVSLITPANIAIMSSIAGAVPAQISYNVANSVATLTPDSPLPMGKITVTVQGVADMAGTAMTQPYVFGFSTSCSGGGGTSGGNEYLYVSPSLPPHLIYGYRIDSSTGMLMLLAGSPFQANLGSPAAETCTRACGINLLADPLGRFLFFQHFVDPSSGEVPNIGSILVNASTGALTSANPVPSGVENISVDPMGRFLYGDPSTFNTIGNYSNVIAGYQVNSGNVTPAPGTPYAVPGQLANWAPAVTDKFAYVVDEAESANHSMIYGFSVDQRSGALTPLPTGPTQGGDFMSGHAVNPAGDYLFSEQEFRQNGAFHQQIVGFAIHPDGSLTQLDTTPQVTPSEDVAQLVMSPNGNFLYHVASNDLRAYAIDQNTGALTLTAVYANLDNGKVLLDPEVVIDPDVKYVYLVQSTGTQGAVNELAAYRVNPMTGAISQISGDVVPLAVYPLSLSIVRAQ